MSTMQHTKTHSSSTGDSFAFDEDETVVFDKILISCAESWPTDKVSLLKVVNSAKRNSCQSRLRSNYAHWPDCKDFKLLTQQQLSIKLEKCNHMKGLSGWQTKGILSNLESKNTIWAVLWCWWALMDHQWVSGSPAHPCHAITKQSELAHYWGPLRRPLLYRFTVIHLVVTLFPHNKLDCQAARNNMRKIGIAHTVNFNQSPQLCVSPACFVFVIPLRSGWPW